MKKISLSIITQTKPSYFMYTTAIPSLKPNGAFELIN